MGKVIYEVKLSPDGRHSVSVKSDDPLSLKDALPLAKKIQEHLLGVTAAPGKQPSVQAQDPEAPEAQLCGVHSTPMTQVQGKHGPFWSCHQRNLDGSWCNFRPARGRSPRPTYSYPTV